jgi:Zn-dependent peptidase ImmA (M78 family)/transcriptional regulator with XRE-family HTH domain
MRRAFNPDMLILARESRGLTQKDLADKLQLSQGEMSKIEAGIHIPPSSLVDNLSAALNYPRRFFFIDDSMKGSTSACVYYRKRQATPLGVIRRSLAIANARRIQISQLLVSGNAQIDANAFAKLDVESNGGPEHIAQMIRTMWKIAPGPVSNMIEAIEDAGGIVFRCDFGTTKIDALSQWLQGLPPIFFINERMPTDRMRWTLAHELGHVLMHQLPNEDIEREADHFASEFLMPKNLIRPYLEDLSLAKLASLKPHWKVSMAALLKRASDLGTITSRQKSYLWAQMGAHGYRTEEPITLPPEEPTLVRELIDLHRGELGYSERQISELLILHEHEARSEYLRSNARLRIVG